MAKHPYHISDEEKERAYGLGWKNYWRGYGREPARATGQWKQSYQAGWDAAAAEDAERARQWLESIGAF